jgi:hypothetical protein
MTKCGIFIWEGERNNTTYRQYLEEISPYDMYASTKKEVAHTVQPIMLKLHTKFQIISMDGSQVLEQILLYDIYMYILFFRNTINVNKI